MLRAVLLSNFDVRIGPTVALSVPALSLQELKSFNVIPKLIDVAGTEGFFISTLEKIYSANYYFTIENVGTRGNKDLLLLSIAVQVADDVDNEKILLFLKNSEGPLRERVRNFKENDRITEMGILSTENSTFLADSLHGFFNTIFDGEQFDKLPKHGQDRIGIFAQQGFDPERIINYFRRELNKERTPSLRTRLVVNAIDELSYNPFHCKERQSATCLKDKCPACTELVKESEAVIYMLDSGTFQMGADFKDMIDYLKGIDNAKNVPVLVMQIDGNPSINGALVYEELTARLQEEITRQGLKIQPKHARVPLGNTEAFKECMSWLIKAII
jgi:hypothetical protein